MIWCVLLQFKEKRNTNFIVIYVFIDSTLFFGRMFKELTLHILAATARWFLINSVKSGFVGNQNNLFGHGLGGKIRHDFGADTSNQDGCE